MPYSQEEQEDIDKMAEKADWLANLWLRIYQRIAIPYKEAFELNPALTQKATYHYAKDLRVLKKRYQIEDKAQAPNVAGLMAGAILKYRPLVPFYGPQDGIEKDAVNEFLAIYYGICVCANYRGDGAGNKEMAALMAKPHFRLWLRRFAYLLKERNFTSEALILIFETLCLFAFPDALEAECD